MALPPFLSDDALLKFRTRHCERFVQFGRCQFGDNQCQYSHQLDWTRRPLWKYNYQPQLCQFVRFVPIGGVERLVHGCCLHRNCPWAHSREEQLYHPKVYKKQLCERFLNGSCPRFYCPFAHNEYELTGPIDDASVSRLFANQRQDELCPVDPPPARANTLTNRTAPWQSEKVNYAAQRKSVDPQSQSGSDKHQPPAPPRNDLGEESDTPSTSTETIKVCFRSHEVLTAVWIGLSRISSLKHPHLAPMKPRYLCHDGARLERHGASHGYGGGVVYISVEKGLRPFDQVIDLSLLQDSLETAKHPPQGLIDLIAAFIKGVEALHRNQIVHGQILPSGILVNSQRKVVLSGFLSGILSLYPESMLSEESLVWNSPEVILAILSGNPEAIRPAKTASSDMWNVGLCLFYLLNNASHPFGNSTSEIFSNILSDNRSHLQRLQARSPLLFDLLKVLLNAIPERRSSATEALQHPFFWTVENTRAFLHQFCSMFISMSPVEADPSLCSPIHWLDTRPESRFTSLASSMNGFLGLRISQQRGGLELLDEGIRPSDVPDNLDWGRLLSAVHSQTTVGLMAYVFLVSINDRIQRDVQDGLIRRLVSDFPVSVVAAYKELRRSTEKLKSSEGQPTNNAHRMNRVEDKSVKPTFRAQSLSLLSSNWLTVDGLSQSTRSRDSTSTTDTVSPSPRTDGSMHDRKWFYYPAFPTSPSPKHQQQSCSPQCHTTLFGGSNTVLCKQPHLVDPIDHSPSAHSFILSPTMRNVLSLIDE